jgi:hypothetical protein
MSMNMLRYTHTHTHTYTYKAVYMTRNCPEETVSLTKFDAVDFGFLLGCFDQIKLLRAWISSWLHRPTFAVEGNDKIISLCRLIR